MMVDREQRSPSRYPMRTKTRNWSSKSPPWPLDHTMIMVNRKQRSPCYFTLPGAVRDVTFFYLQNSPHDHVTMVMIYKLFATTACQGVWCVPALWLFCWQLGRGAGGLVTENAGVDDRIIDSTWQWFSSWTQYRDLWCHPNHLSINQSRRRHPAWLLHVYLST